MSLEVAATVQNVQHEKQVLCTLYNTNSLRYFSTSLDTKLENGDEAQTITKESMALYASVKELLTTTCPGTEILGLDVKVSVHLLHWKENSQIIQQD